MDARFRLAEIALNAGDFDRVAAILKAEPELATARSSRSHPTLMQCLVLVNPPPEKLEPLIRLLAGYGSELTDPVIAAACMGNVRAISLLLDLGARIDGNGRWSPLEEALYWGFAASVKLLLERGAAVDNLRKAAALGQIDVLRACFDERGALTKKAGQVASPFEKLDRFVTDDVRHDPRQIINNALVYAAGWGQHAALQELLDRGADLNAIPAGFDFAGTPLHYAALRGHRDTVDWLLERGADPSLRDTKIGNLPEDWAAHDGHTELAAYLKAKRERG
jgi:ankyrin repeat protein